MVSVSFGPGIIILMLVAAVGYFYAKIKVKKEKALVKNSKLTEQDLEGITKKFVEPTEKHIVTLGNQYLSDCINGVQEHRAFITLSDKYMYIEGDSTLLTNVTVTTKNEIKRVDIKEITGLQITKNSNKIYLRKALIFSGVSIIVFIFLSTVSVMQ